MRLVTVLLISLAAAPAVAADMPVKAAPQPVQYYDGWSGFYMGGNAGYFWDVSGFIAGLPTDAPHGPMGGVQIGVDQALAGSNVVVGVRANLDYGSVAASNGPISAKATLAGAIDAKLGLLLSKDVMLYGIGGYAVTNPSITTPDFSFKETASGWNAGVGIETKIPNSKWSTFIEAGYIETGSTAKLQAGYAAGGVNYRF